MARCVNCGAEVRRDRSIFRDTEVCEVCGWWCHAPGTGLTWAAAVSAFVLGAIGSVYSEPTTDDPRQA